MKRTTIEIDEDLLAQAKRALGKTTARATVEEALRQAANRADVDRHEAAARLHRFFQRLRSRADVAILASGEMWR